MFRQLNLRDRLVAMAIAPLLVVAVMAIGLLVIDTSSTGPFALVTILGLVAAGAVSFTIGRSIIASLAEVADGAEAIAAGHDATRSTQNEAPGDSSATAEASQESADPIQTEGPLTSNDDGVLGRLVSALNHIDAATIEADRTHHDEVREGLRSIVTNLARRSQTLLDRQVEYLDQLESGEEDPDRLDQLFKVDHLATRMRRNAESLIVLAEADPGRRRGGPVDIADVLRVAMGEVEIYQQIEVLDVDEGQINAGGAVDLAHLTAELMENATQFSPPSTPVRVTGRFDGQGRFAITIADQGMGMTPERLAETNELLANPPELGLEMGRSLGFMVVGRLAQRLGATVVVNSNPDGAGLTAIISAPASLFTPSGSTAGPAQVPIAPSARPAKPKGDTAEMLQPLSAPKAPSIAAESAPVEQFDWGVGSMVDPDPAGEPANDSPDTDAGTDSDSDSDTWTPPEVTRGAPAKLAEAVPSGDAFEDGVASLLDEAVDNSPIDRPTRGLRDDEATATGLTKRPRSSSERPAGADRPLATAKRDPEEVRSRLMRYREGLSGRNPKSGRDQAGENKVDQDRPESNTSEGGNAR